MKQQYLQQALDLARQGAGRVSPNPAVGCVIVQGGEVAGTGFHVYAQVNHAEVAALEQAGARARGATAYVTLEPCSHTGRTGPCCEALIGAGIARVVAIQEDPNPQVAGRGFARLREAGIEVEIDSTLAAEAERLNLAFFFAMRTGRPLVTLKSALTLDGKIAAPEDNSGWITSEQARAHVQQVRHLSDAILTGIGTALADDPMLNDRSGLERSRPLLRIVVDSQLRLPVTSKLVQSAARDLLVVCSSVARPDCRAELEAHGVEVVALDGEAGRPDLRRIIPLLAERQYRSLMIEAGSKINGAAFDAGIVDRVFFYYAPKILGGLQSLPVVGGRGRRRRIDAIRLHDISLHQITKEEFALEGWVVKETH